MTITYRKVDVTDAKAISELYAYYVEHTTISFESDAPSVEETKRRIESISKKYPYIVAVNEINEVIGYAYAKPFGKTAGYKFSVETSIYLTHTYQKGGVGKNLYKKLEAELKRKKINTMIASITADNHSSILFHEKIGFSKGPKLMQVGYKFDKWLDVLWMQKIIE